MTIKCVAAPTNALASDPTGLALNKALFWDAHIDAIDLETHSRFIIERVVTRGNLADWHLLKKIYGTARIREEVIRIRSLDRKTVSFLSAYFNIEQREFRCCS